MEIINGEFCTGLVFSATAEPYALAQVKAICDNRVSSGCIVRVMPDVHPGMLAPIGLTMTVGDRVLPYLVGIDIGCGMTTVRIAKHRGMEFQKLDSVIRESVPSGFAVQKNAHRFASRFAFDALLCQKHVYEQKAALSLGTLGGGNHFIEVDYAEGDEKSFFLTVHSGSRHLGKEVTDWYLQAGSRSLKEKGLSVPYELTYLEDELKEAYLHDVACVQEFASLNRLAIIDEIARGMKWKLDEPFSCIHNYVDFRGDVPILRKGAVSARNGERVIIPINMRDGILLGTGKGNADWNYSAPHGAGRVLKREDVKKSYTVSAFKASMRGVYSSCIGKETLDEAPFAYRGIEEIRAAVEPTVSVEALLKPVYNFKAPSED